MERFCFSRYKKKLKKNTAGFKEIKLAVLGNCATQLPSQALREYAHEHCYDENGGWLGRHVFWQALTRDDGMSFYRVQIPPSMLKFRGQYTIRFAATASRLELRRISLWEKRNSGLVNVW